MVAKYSNGSAGQTQRLRRRVRGGFAVVAGLLLLACAARASTGEDAVAVVAGLQRALVETAAVEPPLSLEQRYERLAPVILDAHDFERMGRLTVRRFWGSWSEAERARFVEAFERLSVTTYASRFAHIGAGAFEIVGTEGAGGDRIEVKALIHRKDDADVSMDYLLEIEDAHWRIINVFADGASELSIMASEYFDILDSHGFDALIDHIDAATAAL